jgi:hypothetical protein
MALISDIVRNRGDIVVAAIPEATNGGTSETKIRYKAYYLLFICVHIKGISIHTD